MAKARRGRAVAMPKRAAPSATVRPRTHPELARALARKGTAAGPLGAVCRLRPRKDTDLALGPGETEATARRVLGRVARAVGERPERWNAFRNLGAFAVIASPLFLRELVAQPEIEAAMPNRLPGEELLIRPVKKRPAASRPRKKPRAGARLEKG